eukprot:GHVN01104786.1.p1 GENE.GHVN01104786.1~~GHVN01104786.1.p1  ORF type:complete len:318 (-),score=12.40 GHVN01104786.1:370-1323(-)
MTGQLSPRTVPFLGKGAANGIKLINALKDAGADHDLQLPRIVFAGKQSAGKSSLVEAVTGISLPRGHGTCTKGPIEVTTVKSNKESWECKISLRITVDKDDKKLSTPVNSTLATISNADRAQMACIIKDAQHQLLEVSGDKQKFTKNCICVQIQGSECEDLSIVDLPGLIQSTDEKSDEKYIGMVEDLVREYLSCSKTVILQCLQSDEDIENQKIRTFAREFDPKGNRCLGVLTKPDKLEAYDDISKMLQGSKYELQWGYFVVRTPKQDELTDLEAMDDQCEAFRKVRKSEHQRMRHHTRLAKSRMLSLSLTQSERP